MKRLFDRDMSMDDLKMALASIHEKEDKKAFYIMVGIMITVLAASVIGIVWLLKNKLDDEDYDDWDYDWDEEEDDDYCCGEDEEDCCCTDKDIDKSVKVEKL